MKKNGIPKSLTKQSTKLALRVKNVNMGLVLVVIESHFRPLYFRVIEYIYWLILCALNSRKHKFISLGKSQVQFTHIKKYCIKNNIKINFITIIGICENTNSASKMAEFVLENSSKYEPISKRYTGRYNVYYEKLVNEVFSHMNAIIQK